MKSYENVSNYILQPRTPIIIRIDGRAFHTVLRKAKKPFDKGIIDIMNIVAKEVCITMQTSVFAYVQSDEINLLLNNYPSHLTQPFFDNRIQKLCSIAASTAAVNFSILYGQKALFDARVFTLPKEEVVNYFIWRQQDWTRNSVQMLARSLYSHKQCENKNCSELQEMTFQKGFNWNDLATDLKRGRCIYKVNNEFIIDDNIPIFTEDRNFIQQWVDYTRSEE